MGNKKTTNHKGGRNGGRKRGTPNKLTADLRKMIMKALTDSGGVKYLKEVAASDPKTFCALLGRIIPASVDANDNSQVNNVILLPAAKTTAGWDSAVKDYLAAKTVKAEKISNG